MSGNSVGHAFDIQYITLNSAETIASTTISILCMATASLALLLDKIPPTT